MDDYPFWLEVRGDVAFGQEIESKVVEGRGREAPPASRVFQKEIETLITTRLLDPRNKKDIEIVNKIRTVVSPHLSTIHRSGHIFVAFLNGEIVAVLGSSPVFLVHDFYVSPKANLDIRSAADALVRYAMGAARGMSEREAVFVVDENNKLMRDFVVSVGAVSDGSPASLFMVKL